MTDTSGEERLEQLITRHLDGCIDSEEQSELDGLIESDPEARRVWEATARLDAMAADALQWVASRGEDPAILPARVAPDSGRRWYRPVVAWGSLAALIAVVATMLLGRGAMGPEPGSTGENFALRTPEAPDTAPGKPIPRAMWPVAVAPSDVMRDLTQPLRRRRRFNVEPVGIVDGDRVYLTTFDQSHVAAVPVRAEF